MRVSLDWEGLDKGVLQAGESCLREDIGEYVKHDGEG